MTSNDGKEKTFSPELELYTIPHNGRDIAYATSVDNGLPPVLYFYPVGAGRRSLLSFRRLFAHLHLICINRPGKGGTSPSKRDSTHLETVVSDVIAVLDHMNLAKVSVLTQCAGTPFGMAFSAQYPERTSGKFIGISTWVQPGDCHYENTKFVYFIGTLQPRITSPLAGTFMSTMMGSIVASFPTSWFATMLRKKLSSEEAQVFDEVYNNDEFSDVIQWMQQDWRGGLNDDLKVLLEKGVVDYKALDESQSSITLWHGTNDTMVPYVGAEWLAKQVPGATLNPIQDGTHEGCMFLLHSEIVDSLKTLA